MLDVKGVPVVGTMLNMYMRQLSSGKRSQLKHSLAGTDPALQKSIGGDHSKILGLLHNLLASISDQNPSTALSWLQIGHKDRSQTCR